MMKQSSIKEPLRPFDARMLDVGDGHWIYVEEAGRRDGVPCLFLHGGPGGGSQHMHRRLFDPSLHYAILFDQRGAGRSHPYLSVVSNTTDHLVADIERIREHFGVERWSVVGGSWGATLALAYAERFPHRVAALVLRAVFLGTRTEVEWAFVEGPKRFRPELFNDFATFLSQAERTDPLAAYLHKLADPERSVHAPAARIWHAYERALSELTPARTRLRDLQLDEGSLPPTPFFEAHYIRHDFFLEPGQLLNKASQLKGIPGAIIQGRYDLLCPPKNAFALAEAWTGSRLMIMESAGHAMTEPGVMEAMTEAVRSLTAA